MKSLSARALALAIASGAVVFGGRQPGSRPGNAAPALMMRAPSRISTGTWWQAAVAVAPSRAMPRGPAAAGDRAGGQPQSQAVPGRAISPGVQCGFDRQPGSRSARGAELSQAFVAYVRDTRRDPNVGIITWTSDSARTAVAAPRARRRGKRAVARRLCRADALDEPDLHPASQAIASRMYLTEQQRRVLAVNLERARALLAGGHRYVIIMDPAVRAALHVRERRGGRPDAGRRRALPDPIAQTPMMSALCAMPRSTPIGIRRRTSPRSGWRRQSSRRVAPISRIGAMNFVRLVRKCAHHRSDVIDWRAVAAVGCRLLRQKPGPANSMGKMSSCSPTLRASGCMTLRRRRRSTRPRGLQQRLRAARRRAAFRTVAVRLPTRSRKARGPSKSSAAQARSAPHHLSHRGPERHVDHLSRRYVRPRFRPGSRRRKSDVRQGETLTNPDADGLPAAPLLVGRCDLAGVGDGGSRRAIANVALPTIAKDLGVGGDVSLDRQCLSVDDHRAAAAARSAWRPAWISAIYFPGLALFTLGSLVARSRTA